MDQYLRYNIGISLS